MTAQSNLPLPKEPQRWKEGEWVYYFNHKDNGYLPTVNPMTDKSGQRYKSEFTITRSKDDISLKEALVRHKEDIVFEQKIIDTIEVEGKYALDVVKTYNPSIATLSEINIIITDIKDEKPREWTVKTDYKEGNEVLYMKLIYICLKDHTSDDKEFTPINKDIWKLKL